MQRWALPLIICARSKNEVAIGPLIRLKIWFEPQYWKLSRQSLITKREKWWQIDGGGEGHRLSPVFWAVKARLTDQTLKELQGITSDLEGCLSSLIESHVYINKELQGVVGKSTRAIAHAGSHFGWFEEEGGFGLQYKSGNLKMASGG